MKTIKNAVLTVALLGLFAGCSSIPLIQKQVDPAIGQIIYVPGTNAMATIRAAQGGAAMLPPPANLYAEGALTAIALALGVFAKWKGSKLTTSERINSAIIAGVEAAGNAAVKSSIQTHAAAAGVGSELDTNVQKVTDSMPDKS